MADPIEAHYTPDGDDWTIAVTGRGRTLTGRAPGLIAARDRADQLVEQLAPEESGRKTVVHMLNGDAVEFTEAYLTARLAREPAEPLEEPTAEDTPKDEGQEAPPPAPSAEAPQPAPAKPTPTPRAASHAAPAEEPTPTGP
jgi:hypothetical protein